MNPIDIINAGTGRVRSDAAMMAEYKKQFKEQFGYDPACPTCGDVRDWNLFKNFAYGNTQPQNITDMSNTTFKLFDQHEIYSYDYADKKTGRTLRVRTYGNAMTEDFAEKFLTEGTDEQIAERKKLFKTLPIKFQEGGDEKPADKQLSDFTVAELQQKATDAGFPAEEWKSLKKDELVSYLEAKDLKA